MSELEQALLVKHGLDLLPGTLRRTILQDDAFLSEFGLSADASISFDGGVAEFRTSNLFAAIREAANAGRRSRFWTRREINGHCSCPIFRRAASPFFPGKRCSSHTGMRPIFSPTRP